MIAIDTNVLLRVILDDDGAQVAAVRAVMEREDVFVPISVLLETGWVLQSRYGLARGDVAEALGLVVMLEGVFVPRRKLASWAIERYRAGADLADVMHLVAASKLRAFATFDRRLAREAGPDSPVPIETLA